MEIWGASARGAPHRTSKTHQKNIKNCVYKELKKEQNVTNKSFFFTLFVRFCWHIFAAFCVIFWRFWRNFLTMFGPLFGALLARFFSICARAGISPAKNRENRPILEAACARTFRHIFDMFFHRFGVPFCIVFRSFFGLMFAPFLWFCVVCCRCFVCVFLLLFHTFGLFFACVLGRDFSVFFVRFSHKF